MKSKRTKGLMTIALIIMTLGTLVSLEELNFVHPKEEAMNKALVKYTSHIAQGKDFEQVETELTSVAKDIGMDDVNITINGIQLYGQVVHLTIDGHIKANTITRKIFNTTQVPYKASLEINVGLHE